MPFRVCPFRPEGRPGLERVLQAEANDSVQCILARARDLHERTRAGAEVGIVEMGRVGQVEELSPELDALIIIDPEVTEDGEVQIHPGGSSEDVSSTGSVTIEIA